MAIISAHHIPEVAPALSELQHRVEQDHLHAIGYISYEAAGAFDSALQTHLNPTLPLLWFALCPQPTQVSQSEMLTRLRGSQPGAHEQPTWQGLQNAGDYAEIIHQLHAQIRDGAFYQVNYTKRLRAEEVDVTQLLSLLAHQAPYGAFIDTDNFAIASASPELFFQLNGTQIQCKPMKGTAARAPESSQDQRNKQRLAASSKDRAENLMIVDMVRNDLSRIASPGSVHVPALFDIERYPTVWQMTSTVRASTQGDLRTIMSALFPGASITGAPKAASMQRIVELEDAPREVYTGAIGVVAPRRQATFNIAIRTAWLDKSNRRAVYGVGSGIVADSAANREWDELHAKCQVLFHRVDHEDDFALLETMRWTGRNIYLWDAHVQRLRRSAAYFGFKLDEAHLQDFMRAHISTLPRAPQRLRVTLTQTGELTFSHSDLPANPPATEVPLATQPITSNSPLLYHKTTARQLYTALENPSGRETLLYNEHHQITESTIANVVYRWQGLWWTPPLQDGLLPGVMRADLLDHQMVRERSLPLDQLPELEALYLVNALRGWRRVHPLPQSAQATCQAQSAEDHYKELTG
ncbi:MAG: chorismate-binding protein [Pseudomonadota bacterium]